MATIFLMLDYKPPCFSPRIVSSSKFGSSFHDLEWWRGNNNFPRVSSSKMKKIDQINIHSETRGSLKYHFGWSQTIQIYDITRSFGPFHQPHQTLELQERVFPKIVGFPPKSSICSLGFPSFPPSILVVFPLFLETSIYLDPVWLHLRRPRFPKMFSGRQVCKNGKIIQFQTLKLKGSQPPLEKMVSFLLEGDKPHHKIMVKLGVPNL